MIDIRLPDILNLSTKFYDFSISRNLFSCKKNTYLVQVGTDAYEADGNQGVNG